MPFSLKKKSNKSYNNSKSTYDLRTTMNSPSFFCSPNLNFRVLSRYFCLLQLDFSTFLDRTPSASLYATFRISLPQFHGISSLYHPSSPFRILKLSNPLVFMNGGSRFSPFGRKKICI